MIVNRYRIASYEISDIDGKVINKEIDRGLIMVAL
jgi:hypothetical protein